MLKIAFFLTSLANKGPTIATRDVIKSLLGHVEMEVFYFDDIIELDMFVKTQRIDFFEKINFDNYDILHSCMFRPDMYLYMHGLFTKKTFFRKCVSTIHCVISEDLLFTYGKTVSWIFTKIWLRALAAMNKIVVTTESMKLIYKQNFDESKLIVIPYGREIIEYSNISVEDQKQIFKLKQKFKIIGTVGSLIKRKNTEQVINFLVTNAEFALISLGIGEEEKELRELAKNLNVDSRVLFLGFRPDSRLYYKYFDVFALPSRSEGFGLVLIDSMAYQIPIVLSNLDIYKSTLTCNEVVFFNLDDNTSFQNAVLKAYNNKELLTRNAYKKYFEEFSLDALKERYLKLFRKIKE